MYVVVHVHVHVHVIQVTTYMYTYTTPLQYPEVLSEDERCRLWYRQDATFKLPRGYYFTYTQYKLHVHVFVMQPNIRMWLYALYHVLVDVKSIQITPLTNHCGY